MSKTKKETKKVGRMVRNIGRSHRTRGTRYIQPQILQKFVGRPMGAYVFNFLIFHFTNVTIVTLIFFYFAIVTRSQQRLLNYHAITRECYIQIEKNLPTIATAWLDRPRTPPALPEPNHWLEPAHRFNHQPHGPRPPRRASVASCKNLFH